MLYTVILDYEGGTYLSQGSGNSPLEGMQSSIENSDFSEIPELKLVGKAKLIKELESGGLVSLGGLQSVFCATAEIDNSLCIAHLVATNQT